MNIELHPVSANLAPKRKKSPQRPYFAGPVDLKWLQTAAIAGGKALAVGVALLHVARMERSSRTKVQPSVIRSFGVGRHSQYRALKALEQHGLISIMERKRGRGPVVILLNQIPDGQYWS